MSSRASRANGRLGEWATRRRGDTATRWRGNTRGVRTTLFGRLFQGESLLEPNPGLKPWAILLCHFVAFAVSPYRRIAVSPYRRIAVSPYRRIAVSPYRRIAASPHRRIPVSHNPTDAVPADSGRSDAESRPQLCRRHRVRNRVGHRQSCRKICL